MTKITTASTLQVVPTQSMITNIFIALIVILSINGIFSSRSVIITSSGGGTPAATSSSSSSTITTITTTTTDAQTKTATKVEETLQVSASSPYKIVIDGGSTGSRLHIFEFRSDDNTFDNNDNDSKEKKISVERRGSTRVNIPLSNFANMETLMAADHDDEGMYNNNNNNNNNNHTEQKKGEEEEEHSYENHAALHLLPLFKYASKVIPKEYHSTTSISIQATAGMRLVTEEHQNKLYDYVYDTLMKHEEFVFDNFDRSDISTLDGVLEGLYGAIAVNYLKGVVDVHLHYNDDSDNSNQVDDDYTNDDYTNDDENSIENKNDSENNNFESDIQNEMNEMENEIEDEDLMCSRKSPLGALDLGGASMQIVYLPPSSSSLSSHQNGHKCSTSTDVNEDTGIDVAGSNESVKEKLPSHELYSTSYLSYGSDQFRERLWDTWIVDYEKTHQKDHQQRDDKVILNPCSFQGYQNEWKGYILLGTGDARQCTRELNRLIPHSHHEDVNNHSEENNGSNNYSNHESGRRNVVGGIEHPPISGEFYAMSLFFFVMDCVRAYTKDETLLRTWPKPSIHELSNAVESFCSKHWLHDVIQKHGDNLHQYTRREILSERCFESVYIITLLRDGFGFSAHSRDITYSFLVNGSEVEWSLGMAISLFAQEKEEKREDVSSNLLENALVINEDGMKKVDGNTGHCKSNGHPVDAPSCDDNVTECVPNDDANSKVNDKDFTMSHFRENGPLWL